MIWTNNYNLPINIENAIKYDPYKKEGHFSITELIKPPQMRVLEKRYDSKIIVDISEGLWRLLGQAVHYILEQGEHEEHIQEERLGIDVNGIKVTGKIDLYSGTEKKVIDYKVTSVWSFIFGDKPEWEAQLNLYKLLYEDAGFPVHGLEIHAILRDWQQSRVNDSGYPEIPFQRVEVPMWSKQQAEDFLNERVKLHLEAEKLDDEALPPCTPEEQWIRPSKVALMKKGRKTAIKLFEEADIALATDAMNEANSRDKRKPYYLQERPGQNVRCEGYCNAKLFCHQYKRENQKED